MKFANNVIELVGKTPLVKINKITKDFNCFVLAKLEFYNPLSSVKDRITVAMIEDARKKGLIKKDTVIIEPTSGNTGIGLAFVCAVYGYRLILTMPDTMSIERRKLLKAFGAEVVLTPGQEGMSGAVKKAREILAETSGSFMPQQFENSANPEIHKLTTGPEIWQDTDGKIDIFVSGIGTGGTITGVSEVLKQKKPDVQIIGVEPFNSNVISGGKPGIHKIQGIGAGFIPGVFKKENIDEIIKVKDEDAKDMTRRLIKEEGIFCGISSGAAMCGVTEVLKNSENQNKTIVVLFPDTGERYLSTWLFEDNA
jgi:cysteine synthase A